ncbi:cation channel sperm-associated protein subunit epsilon-like [Lytechinus variegatus]|uniref:cation channel sperm-associated protein subunit epsilon-like n=1 Tax=Lytechinus variegatus TaxID=7654 RepID=UPI001BB16127|nr:cation channel sperm-associated protein subunit epsilon-like [Lytechinus variegatus]
MSKIVFLHLVLITLGIFLCLDFCERWKLADAVKTQWSANQDTLPEAANLYSTRLPLKVRYFGEHDTFVKWIAPGHCSATHPSEEETEISCTLAGLHGVRVKYRDDHDGDLITDLKVVIMKNSPTCYMWYVLVEKRTWSENEIVVKVWIWDPLLSSIEEMKQIATKPSKFSERLTKIFAGKGQIPGMLESIPDPRFHLDSSNMTFIEADSIWEFYVRVDPCKIHKVQVSGKPSVASHGCFIRYDIKG